MLQVIFLIMLLPLIMVNSESIDPWKFETILQFLKGIADTERNLLDSLGDKDSASAISDTLRRMREADRKITNLTRIIAPITYFYPIMDHVRPTVKFESPLVSMLETMDLCTERIRELYETFVHLSSEKTTLNQNELGDWINASISNNKDDLLDKLETMFSILISRLQVRETSMFHAIARAIPAMKPKHKCGFKLSMQQRVDYSLTVVLVYQLKAFLATVYAQTLNAIRTKEIDKSVYDKREADTVLRILQYMLAAQSAMKLMVDSRKVIACDAKEKTPETYTSFSLLYSNILISLADTRRDRTCAHWCRDVDNVAAESCDPKSPYCAARPCYGVLSQCIEIDRATICELPAESNRRYQWIQQESTEKYYGQATDCKRDGTKSVIREVDIYQDQNDRWCNLCFCKCTETKKLSTAARFVSSMPQLADIAENKVVTGINIYESEHMIQMQIKQGTLMGKGRIDDSTNQWRTKPVLHLKMSEYSSFAYYQEYINDSGGWYDLSGYTYKELKQDIKFIFIDDIILEKDYVVTGARWNFFKDSSNRQGFQIEVHATKYDHATGKLDASSSQWVTPQNMTIRDKDFYGRDRRLIELKEPDDSLKAPYNHPKAEPNSVITIVRTNLDKDAGQHTVPYFDTQKVETFPPVASSGLSVYYRGHDGFGGFIGLALTAVDLSDSLITEIEDDDLEKYKNDFSDVSVYI